jgi:predicted ATPase
MIREISIRNFKSVEDLTVPLGRITVLIGENGSGKSNILEAIALLGAAAADKLDNEFLVSRGIRVAEQSLMLSAFPTNGETTQRRENKVRLAAKSTAGKTFSLSLSPEDCRWNTLPRFSLKVSKEVEEKDPEHPDKTLPIIDTPEKLLALGKPRLEETNQGLRIVLGPIDLEADIPDEIVQKATQMLQQHLNELFSKDAHEVEKQELHCGRFLIYAPENSALRKFEEEGQILPVGIRGEGLFKALQSLAGPQNTERLDALKASLELVGWFFDFALPKNLAPGENRLQIFDRYLGPEIPFDQRSANEGFLFLLFYFTIFLHEATPTFFAIDNIDATLNPKLCAEMMRRLCELAQKYNKQVILTTHNPAVLDGLNLSDDEQRLYAVSRNEHGRTKLRRIGPPKLRQGQMPAKLSDAFMHGLIGGLPKNF